MTLEVPTYIWAWSCQSAFLLRHTILLDLLYIGTWYFFRWGEILSLRYHDDFEEWRFIMIRLCMIDSTSPTMLDLEMLTLGHNPLIGDGFCEMIVYARHILPRDYLALRAYPFWDDVFILGRSYLADFNIETRHSVYDCYFWWIIELLTP